MKRLLADDFPAYSPEKAEERKATAEATNRQVREPKSSLLQMSWPIESVPSK